MRRRAATPSSTRRTDLDAGDPVELGGAVSRDAAGALPQINVLGGCCGTDHRHIERICAECKTL